MAASDTTALVGVLNLLREGKVQEADDAIIAELRTRADSAAALAAAAPAPAPPLKPESVLLSFVQEVTAVLGATPRLMALRDQLAKLWSEL